MRLQTLDARVDADEVRREEHDGDEYVVAPVVAVQEMILKGEFLPNEEIAAAAPAFSGVPLPVGHPKVDGEFVSANTPERRENLSVGWFYNTEHTDRSLVGEVWIDVQKSKRLASESDDDAFVDALKAVLRGDPVEVSTAYWYERQDEMGTHDGESYDSTQANLKPDHLALLPNSEGECSLDDGCGVRTDDGTAGGEDGAGPDPDGEPPEAESAGEYAASYNGESTLAANARLDGPSGDSASIVERLKGVLTSEQVTETGGNPVVSDPQTDTEPMSTNRTEFIVQRTQFTERQANSLDDGTTEALYETVQAAADCECDAAADNEDDGDSDTDTDSESDGPSLDGLDSVSAQSGSDGSDADAIETVVSELRAVREDVEEIKNRDPAEAVQREKHIDTITTHSDRFERDALESMDGETLAGLAAEVRPATGGRIGMSGPTTERNGDGGVDDDTLDAYEDLAAEMAGNARGGEE